jgi:ComF family protein
MWQYRYPIAQLIADFKYHRHYSYGHNLAKAASIRFASAYLNEQYPDFLVPTPLHWRRRLMRGFNQSEQLAATLSSSLQIPVAPLLKRPQYTAPQQSLNRPQRQQNLRGAFSVSGNVEGKRLAIIDDVMTTGATATEISRCLLQAGAAEIHIWCLARTPH